MRDSGQVFYAIDCLLSECLASGRCCRRVDGTVVLQKKLRRGAVLDFLSKLEPCLIGMEACPSSHFWAREIATLGHDVRLIPPAYVKPYVKRRKD